MFNATVTKQQALQPYLNSYHYNVAAKYDTEDAHTMKK